MFTKNHYLLNGQLFYYDKKKSTYVKNNKEIISKRKNKKIEEKKIINDKQYQLYSDFMKYQWPWTL